MVKVRVDLKEERRHAKIRARLFKTTLKRKGETNLQCVKRINKKYQKEIKKK